ncbi:unnamed protein product [Trichobilharzia regenti]|nr:unnamed protein product [Trichobilharzia regenti]
MRYFNFYIDELSVGEAAYTTMHIQSLESRLEYTTTPEPSSGKITVVVSCPDPSALNENNSPADVSPKKQSSPTVWPVITLKISLSSPVVAGEKTVDTRDISEVPIIKRLVTNGKQLPKELCVESLEAVHQARWFMNASSRGPLNMVSRILRDFLQSNEYWIDLNEFVSFTYLINIVLQHHHHHHTSKPNFHLLSLSSMFVYLF